jgi:hypothetical protein
MKRLLPAATAFAVAAILSVPLAYSSSTPVHAETLFPHYDHVFLMIEENHSSSQIIGNSQAPEINALAADYGLATNYTGVGDPSEPNYVAMLGGSTFGITSDDPYFFPGHTINAPNLMSQIDQAGLTWQAYLGGIPYAGDRDYCFPSKCLGIPDSDPIYASKHNGIVNFMSEQTPTELAKMTPIQQLGIDLASGNVPNFSYIVPDMCTDMHGAPPWCVDSGKPGDNVLIPKADAFVGQTVNQITSSQMWATGNNAIVVTFDEGNTVSNKVVTVVITNHGPRGIKDNTAYNHYSLLASLQQTFGLGCLQNSCTATPMTPLFQITGSSKPPALPPPFVPPSGTDTVSAMGAPVKGMPATLSCTGGWSVVPSPSIANLDNNLTAVSAISPNDAWAVGDYYDQTSPNVLANMAEHWDGRSWTEYPLPNVGSNLNTLLGVSELPTGHAWAVGYYINGSYLQQTLVQRWDGKTWTVIPSVNPGAQRDILYGVAALADNDVWAVGGQEDANGTWQSLTEHYDGSGWSVIPSPNPGTADLLYAIDAVSSSSVYAVGQQSSAFPNSLLVEHWDGKNWSLLTPPADSTESLSALGVTGTDATLDVVGTRENETVPYTTMVASGAPKSLTLAATPNNGTGEQDLFSATTASDGSTWAGGWYIDPTTGNHQVLFEHEVNGSWSLVAGQNPGTGDNGIAGMAAIPGGGVWAVGAQTNKGNSATLVEFHC